MRRIIELCAVCGAIVFFAPALRASDVGTPISSLPDKGMVTVSGTIEEVRGERDFVLHDNSGSIDVTLAQDESAMLKQGDNVTVTGTVEKPLWGLMGKNISAGSVQVHKDLGATLSDVVTQTTGISLDKAKVVQIDRLPPAGEVRITGVVERVGGRGDNFTVKDATGAVDVSLKSSDSTVLTQGAEVSVVGYVKSGLFGKTVDATHVITLSDVAPAAGPPAGPEADIK